MEILDTLPPMQYLLGVAPFAYPFAAEIVVVVEAAVVVDQSILVVVVIVVAARYIVASHWPCVLAV